MSYVSVPSHSPHNRREPAGGYGLDRAGTKAVVDQQPPVAVVAAATVCGVRLQQAKSDLMMPSRNCLPLGRSLTTSARRDSESIAGGGRL